MGEGCVSQLTPIFKATGLEETTLGGNAEREKDWTPKETEKEQVRGPRGPNMEPSPRYMDESVRGAIVAQPTVSSVSGAGSVPPLLPAAPL